MTISILGAFAVALIVSFLVMPMIIGVLKRKNVFDAPGRRKIHKEVTPSLGGIGIVLGLALSILVWLPIEGLAIHKYFISGVLILFVTGLRDDVIPISPRIKLAAQVLAAIMIMVGGVMINSAYGLFGVGELNMTLAIFITISFVIVFTNAFNLIDGLDGLAGSVAFLMSTFFAVWFYLASAFNLSIIAAATAGALMGFLYHNWQPAKIFMGDTGALALGFLFSVMGIHFLNMNSQAVLESIHFDAPISILIAVFIVPLFDTCRIIIVRLVKKTSPFTADRNHVHHVLMRLGFRHSQVAIVLAGSNLAFILLTIFLSRYGDHILLPGIIIICASFSLLLDMLIIRKVTTKGGRAKQQLIKTIRESQNAS